MLQEMKLRHYLKAVEFIAVRISVSAAHDTSLDVLVILANAREHVFHRSG